MRDMKNYTETHKRIKKTSSDDVLKLKKKNVYGKLTSSLQTWRHKAKTHGKVSERFTL